MKNLYAKHDALQQRFDSLTTSNSSTRSGPTLWAGANSITPQQSIYEYDGIFTSPLNEEICNFPLPPEHKAPNFEMFNGKQDPKQHLINFQEECLLKLGSEEKLMAKFFPRSLKGETSQCFYNFLGGSIDSFKSLVKFFMVQYKYNIK